MRRSLDVILWDIRKHTLILQGYLSDVSFEEFCGSALRKDAAERQIMIVGEGFVRIRDAFPEHFERIHRAREFIRFRNRLVHLYDLMEEEEIWSMIMTVLPVLFSQVETMLAEIHP